MSQPTRATVESTICYIALGSNVTSSLGHPALTIKQCLNRISDESLRLIAESSLYQTPAFPPGSGPDYVNAVAKVETLLPAAGLLSKLHEIEQSLGRIRTERWAPRSIDLDLLAYGSMLLPDLETYETWRNLPLEEQKTRTPDQLILPHPRLQDRAFVLVPWAEIAPDWTHPLLKLTVAQMCDNLDEADKRDVKRL